MFFKYGLAITNVFSIVTFLIDIMHLRANIVIYLLDFYNSILHIDSIDIFENIILN